jgi:hypothetical protein
MIKAGSLVKIKDGILDYDGIGVVTEVTSLDKQGRLARLELAERIYTLKEKKEKMYQVMWNSEERAAYFEDELDCVGL